MDALQEALDLCAYLAQHAIERGEDLADHPRLWSAIDIAVSIHELLLEEQKAARQEARDQRRKELDDAELAERLRFLGR